MLENKEWTSVESGVAAVNPCFKPFIPTQTRAAGRGSQKPDPSKSILLCKALVFGKPVGKRKARPVCRPRRSKNIPAPETRKRGRQAGLKPPLQFSILSFLTQHRTRLSPLTQLAMPSGCIVFHRPRVKSGMITGMLSLETERVVSSRMELQEAASYTTLSGVTPRRRQSRWRQLTT